MMNEKSDKCCDGPQAGDCWGCGDHGAVSGDAAAGRPLEPKPATDRKDDRNDETGDEPEE